MVAAMEQPSFDPRSWVKAPPAAPASERPAAPGLPLPVALALSGVLLTAAAIWAWASRIPA